MTKKLSTRFPMAMRKTEPGTGSNRIRHMVGILTAIMGALALSSTAHASEAVSLPPFAKSEMLIIWIVLASGVISVIVGAIWFRSVNNLSPGTAKMAEVGQAIRDGANAYLMQQVWYEHVG